MQGITFEEIMFTIMSATQDTFKSYLNIDLFAGKVEKKITPLHSDIVGIVGIAGERVGYILIASEMPSAVAVAREMLMADEPDDDAVRDAIGELTNNIAGCFKTRYHERYGSVALGLPMVVSGKVRPLADMGGDGTASGGMDVQCNGVTIPFRSLDGEVAFRVMVYM